MDSSLTAPWWQRLLIGFVATAFTLLLVDAIFAAQSFWREPGLHWFNWSGGGGIQIPAFFLFSGGLIALVMYLVLVAPLVLLWPVRSQLKHWYAFLAAALLVPYLVFGRPWVNPGLTLHKLGMLLLFPTFPVLCGGACYLLLLRRWRARLTQPSPDLNRCSSV